MNGMTGDGSAAYPHPARTSDFRIGEWTIHPMLNRVTRAAETIQVEPRTMHVLVCLAHRPGEVVLREELLAAVWGEVVVNEEALTRSISDLRRILGDDTRRPRVIETIRKTGYRLMVPASPAAAVPPAHGTDEASHGRAGGEAVVERPSTVGLASGGATEAAPRRVARLPRLGLAAVAAAALLVIVLVAVWVGAGRRSAPRPGPMLRGVPLTALPGDERFPALSPDGSQVAFAWDRGGLSNDIYVTRPGADSPVRLTDDPRDEDFSAWSPDGRLLAFARHGAGGGIIVVPAAGGPERVLLSARLGKWGLDWSPNGLTIALAHADSGDRPRIALLSVETGAVRALTHPAAGEMDESPAFSPDGRFVAFVRADDATRQDLYLVPTEGGEARRLTTTYGVISGLDWTPDGRSLVFSGGWSEDLGLRRLDVRSGKIVELPTPGRRATRPSVALKAGCVAYEDRPLRSELWVLVLAARSGASPAESPLIRSTREESHAAWSPDGRHIAFLSTRTGRRALWVCDADGGNQHQLSHTRGLVLAIPPCWSPDGRRIAATVAVDGVMAIYLFDLAGGLPTRLARSARDQVVRFWSREGQRIYFYERTPSGWRPRWAAAASGEVEDAIYPHADLVCESRDGRTQYYVRHGRTGIFSRPTSGGPERTLYQPERPIRWEDIAPVPRGLLTTFPDEQGRALGLLDGATGRLDVLHHFSPDDATHIGVSPDGARILFEKSRTEGDLVLVEALR